MIYKGPDLSFSSFHIAITFPMNDFPPPSPLTFLILWKQILSHFIQHESDAETGMRLPSSIVWSRKNTENNLWLSCGLGRKVIFCLSPNLSTRAFHIYYTSPLIKTLAPLRITWEQESTLWGPYRCGMEDCWVWVFVSISTVRKSRQAFNEALHQVTSKKQQISKSAENSWS